MWFSDVNLRPYSEAALAALQADNRMLDAEARHLEEQCAAVEAERESAVQTAVASLEEELSGVLDERDDLAQRIRFLERQLAKARAVRRCRLTSG